MNILSFLKNTKYNTELSQKSKYLSEHQRITISPKTIQF